MRTSKSWNCHLCRQMVPQACLPNSRLYCNDYSKFVKFGEELGLGTRNSRIQTSTPPLKLKSPGGSHGKLIESPGTRELPRPPRGRSESPLPTHTASPVVEPSDGTAHVAFLDSPSFCSTSGSLGSGPWCHFPCNNRTIYRDTKTKVPFTPQTTLDGSYPAPADSGAYGAGLTTVGEFDTVESYCQYFNWLSLHPN